MVERAASRLNAALRTGTGEPLLVAKFEVDRGARDAVLRTRLHDHLDRAVHHPFTLVTGPAGAGKTTLASSWAARAPVESLVWITLDDGDELPCSFWSYALEGLARSGVALSVPLPAAPQDVDQSFLVRLSADLYGREAPLVVVLDDAEVLVDSEVLAQLDFLLQHAGRQLSVVLVARQHPGAVVERHRLAGSLGEVGPAELAFTHAEARLLLRSRQVELSDADLDGLVLSTRGWAAGLTMAALAARERLDATGALPSVLGDPRAVADYLVTEVLAPQPPAVLRFLRRTSIATHLQVGLADQLTGGRDGARTLAALARTSSFVERCPEHDGCYQYHPMFADLLRDQLQEEDPRVLVRLHRRAATWFAASGSPGSSVEAVAHAAAAGDWLGAAAASLHDFAVLQVLVGAEGDALAAVLERIPARTDGPDVAVVLAVLAIRRGDLDACSTHLTRATGPAEPEAEDSRRELVRTLVALLLARARGDVDGGLCAAVALEAVADALVADGVELPLPVRALIDLRTGGAHFAAGHVELAAAALRRALALASRDGWPALHAESLGELALLEVLAGRLRHGADLARAATEAEDLLGRAPADRPPGAALALAWAHAEWGEPIAARTHVESALQTRAATTDLLTRALLALVRADLRRTARDPEGARSALGAAGELEADALPVWLVLRMDAAAARIELLVGRPDLARGLIAASAQSGSPELVIELARAQFLEGDLRGAADAAARLQRWPDLPVSLHLAAELLQACCALERRDDPQARTSLDRALRLAEPERLRRPFLEAPSMLRSALRRAGSLLARHPWLQLDGTGSSAGSAAAGLLPTPRWHVDQDGPPVLVESLTPKELEVLGHLAALLTTEEIAHTMFVSVNTVKTHVRGILRKLAANRRNEAIRRARELHLL